MLINTDFDEDEDYYEDDHDDFRESHEKDNEGNFLNLIEGYKYLMKKYINISSNSKMYGFDFRWGW